MYCLKIKTIFWILLLTFSAKNCLMDKVFKRFSVKKKANLSSNETIIHITSAVSKIQCAVICARHKECCSSTNEQTTRTCSLYSCCYPSTDFSLAHDLLTITGQFLKSVSLKNSSKIPKRPDGITILKTFQSA